MSRPSEAAAAAREAARRRNGEFGEQPHTDPGDLQLAGGTLADALDRYGVTAADLPGIEEAWATAFAALDGERPPTVKDLADDVLGHPNFGRHRGGPWLVRYDPNHPDGSSTYDDGPVRDDEMLALQVHTRNGGGNRECYCGRDRHDDDCLAPVIDALQSHPLHLHDEDDDFDPTYADFWFRIPDEHRQAFLEVHRNRRAATAYANSEALREDMLAGEVPPWRLLADQKRLAAIGEQLQRAKNRRMDPLIRERHERYVAEADTANGWLTGSDEPGTFNAITVMRDLSRPSSTFTYRRDDVVEVGRKFRTTAAEVDRFKQLRAEAELASPRLREWMLGDREPATYQVQESSGRRARIVTKTYTPLSPFRDAERKAHREHEQAQTGYRQVELAIDGHRRVAQSRIDDADLAELDVQRLTHDLWTAGWPGDPTSCPEQP